MQVMVWQGTVVEEAEYPAASAFLMEALGLETAPEIRGNVTTLPTDGEPGGRIDFVFRICENDVPRAAVKRLGFHDMKWACDADALLYASPLDW